jgi:general secretion pathway protein D
MNIHLPLGTGRESAPARRWCSRIERVPALALFVVLCFCGCPAIGAQPAQQELPPPTTTLVSSLDLSRLADLAAQRLDARIEYTPGQVTGQVTIRGEVSDAELWSLLNARLADSNLTMVATESPKRFRIVKLDQGLASSAPIVDAMWVDAQGEPAATGRTALTPDSDALRLLVRWPGDLPPGYAAVLVPLRFKSGKEAAELIRPLLTKQAGIVLPLGDSGDRVVIADLWSRVSQVLQLLPDVDSPGAAPVIEEVAIRNMPVAQLIASAKELSAKRDLFGDAATSGKGTSGAELVAGPDGKSVLLITTPSRAAFWKDLIQKLDSAPGVETREHQSTVFGAKEVAALVRDAVGSDAGERFRVVVNDLTGTLIVTATASQHERIAALITKLDQTPASASVRLRSFPIRNRPVSEVAGSLEQLLAAAKEAGTLDVAGPSEGRTGGGSEVAPDGRSSQASETSGRRGSPNPADPGASSLNNATSGAKSSRRVAPGSTSISRDRGSGLSLTVDEGMNAIIAVGEPRMLAQVEALLKTLDVRQPQVMIEAFLVSLTDGQSRSVSVQLQKFTSLGGNAVQLSSLFGASASGNPPDISAPPGTAFTGAVLNPGDFNAVIRAIETVNEGKSTSVPRVLVSNNQDAVFRSVAQQPTSNTSTNTTSTTITSFGGFQDAGTTITVRPQIAEGDQLVLTYSVELSSFTGQPAGGLPSPRQENSVSSVSLIPDGHTVVVGGFELTTKSEDQTRVPILGEIPLLGELFKSKTVSDARTRFFVFIRANVMRHDRFEDLKHAGEKSLVEAGLGDGFPEVEPLVIR